MSDWYYVAVTEHGMTGGHHHTHYDAREANPTATLILGWPPDGSIYPHCIYHQHLPAAMTLWTDSVIPTLKLVR